MWSSALSAHANFYINMVIFIHSHFPYTTFMLSIQREELLKHPMSYKVSNIYYTAIKKITFH